MEKHLQHQKELYHNFNNFKKAFDRVWHKGLWRVLKEYNIDNWLIEVITSLCGEATSAVLQMKMLEISFERLYEYDKSVHYLQYYLIYPG